MQAKPRPTGNSFPFATKITFDICQIWTSSRCKVEPRYKVYKTRENMTEIFRLKDRVQSE